MSCNDPLKKCADPQPSGCVQWTGTLPEDSRVSLTGCENSINEILLQFDSNLTLVLDHVEITVDELRDADVCEKIYPNINSLKVKTTDQFVYSDKVILELVKIVCDLQSQIRTIHDTVKLSSDFFDLPLPTNIQNMLSCLVCDDGCDALQPTTLKNFFEIIAKKIVELPCKTCEGGCIDC